MSHSQRRMKINRKRAKQKKKENIMHQNAHRGPMPVSPMAMHFREEARKVRLSRWTRFWRWFANIFKPYKED